MAETTTKGKNYSTRLRLDGVLLHSYQSTQQALTNIRGIKSTKASVILLRSRTNPKLKIGLLENMEIKSVRSVLADLNFATENVLLRSMSLAKQRLFEGRLLRGIRLKKGLTNRGQRTRNNGRTMRKRF